MRPLRPSGPRHLTRAATLSLLLAACAPAPAPTPAPGPASATSPAASLPPIPRVEGPLDVRVTYPRPDQLLTTRDSNFIFGSVGHGGARLTVNGQPVDVKPNGAWLAFLPVPADGRYDLVARVGADSVRLLLPVRLPAPPRLLSTTGALVVDSASLTPSGPVTYPADELVRVSVRAPANATVVLRPSAGTALPLVHDGSRWSTEVPAGRLGAGSRVVVTRDAESVSLLLPAVSATPVGARTLVRLGTAEPADSGDRRIVGRPLPGGTYKWFFLPGTVLERTAVEGGFARVRLADALAAWVPVGDATPLPAGSALPRRLAGVLSLAAADEWVDVRIPLSSPPPYLVEEQGSTIELTLYGTTANVDNVYLPGTDSLVRHVTWEPLPGDRAKLVLQLAHAPFGYLALWRDGAFVLRVRRRPAVDASAPLRGLRIAVDPGHPPIGATGPTGLYEGEAALAVGLRLRDELQRRGATVVMTRTTMDPVGVAERPIIARRANAHALVSVHLNAFPDGVNPFERNGTSTYYFHPHAAPLARAAQAAMVRRMGLRDLGAFYGNLALARPTWMPSVLAEGAFLMIPEQEAALRTPAFQDAYAQALADGLEAFFRAMAGGAR